MVDLARGHGCIAKVLLVAVRGVQAAAGGNAIGWVIHTAKPTGVVIHPTATQLDKKENNIYFERQCYDLKQLHKNMFHPRNGQNEFQATPVKQQKVWDFKISKGTKQWVKKRLGFVSMACAKQGGVQFVCLWWLTLCCRLSTAWLTSSSVL